jgi:hypothetical protein
MKLLIMQIAQPSATLSLFGPVVPFSSARTLLASESIERQIPEQRSVGRTEQINNNNNNHSHLSLFLLCFSIFISLSKYFPVAISHFKKSR